MFDIFAFIPFLGPALWWLGGIWSFVLAVVAMRDSMELGTGEAVLILFAALVALLMVGAVVVLSLIALVTLIEAVQGLERLPPLASESEPSPRHIGRVRPTHLSDSTALAKAAAHQRARHGPWDHP